MRQDAETHAAEDAKKRELIETKNMAESLSYTVEKSLKDAGDKVDASLKTEVEEKLEALKKVKDGDDEPVIKAATEALSTAAQKIGQAMYGQQQQGQPGAGDAAQGQTPPPTDQPIEGEVVDEKKS